MLKNVAVAEFIKKVQFDMEYVVNTGGCEFIKLTDGKREDLYLVLAYDSENGLLGKIAYNVDDLQCDYDTDWEMPCDLVGDVIDTEMSHCEEDDPWELADRVLNITYELINTLDDFREE